MVKTELLYLKDSYLKEVLASVLEVTEEGIIVDKTMFYPGGGGQIYDSGWLVKGGVEYPVERVFKKDDEVYHVVEGIKLDVGEEVLLRLDWDRRYRIMKMHTSLHIIGAIMYYDYNVLITGSNIYPEYARIDFPMKGMNKEIAVSIVAKADSIAREGHEVKTYYMRTSEALKKRELLRLADISKYEKYLGDEVRVVEIVGVDVELDGGTHVKNTLEIGEIKFLKYESKGSKNRRIYITV